jgi:hypothetical protein
MAGLSSITIANDGDMTVSNHVRVVL